jgi:hypothetical protein
MNTIFKSFLPHIIAFVVLMMFSFVYFAPALEGLELSQGDNIQAYGMRAEVQTFSDKGEATPLWSNSAFGGMPVYQFAMPYVGNAVSTLYYGFLMGNGITAPHSVILLCMLGFYFLMIVLKIDWRIAIPGAIVYGLCTSNVILAEAGHSTQIVTMAYTAPTLAGMLLALRGRYWLGGGLAGLFFACQLLANHLQITYYFIMAVWFIAFIVPIEAFQKKQLPVMFKGAMAVIFAMGLAVVTMLPRLLTTYEYTQETTRGKSDLVAEKGKNGLDKDYAFDWSNGVSEVLTIIIPNYKGGGASSSYDYSSMESYSMLESKYGAQAEQYVSGTMYFGPLRFTSGAIYYGAILCFLFVLGLILNKNKLKWAFLIGFLLLTLISMGKNLPALNYFLFDHFPMFNKFRTVSMALGVAQLGFSIVALMGLQSLFFDETADETKKRAIYIAAGSTILLCFLAYIMNTGYTDKLDVKQMGEQLVSAFVADRKSIVWADTLRSIGFISVAAIVAWLLANRTINTMIGLGAFALFILIDVIQVDLRYVSSTTFNEPRTEEVRGDKPLDLQIKQDKDLHYRVVDFSTDPFQSAMASYKHKSMGGYHAAKLGIIQNMIKKYLSNPNQYISVFGLFNTKYAITPEGKPARLQTYGNAWFVKEIQVVETPDAELDSLARLPIGTKAVLRKANEKYISGLNIQYDTTNTIALTAYHPDKMEYKSSAKTEQFALFSEMYYPPSKGWDTYIDGKLVEGGFVQADYAIRGLRIPPGDHKIEMRFEPKSFYGTKPYALIASFLIIAMIAAGAFFYYKETQTPDFKVEKTA